jgi:small subunit ribosomal protein S2
MLMYDILRKLSPQAGAFAPARCKQITRLPTYPGVPLWGISRLWQLRLRERLKEAEEKREGEFIMSVISMKALLESGVHFGHRTHKWHPAMKPYIFTERNGIHIIDLQKTSKAVEQAYVLIRDFVAEGGTLLFVGTKRQAQETIQEEAIRCGMPYVTARWLGGMLTNWRTIRQRINELERMTRMRDKGEFERITKKEALILSREIERLDILLGGVRNMTKLPEALFIVDVDREETAVHEANLLNIPVIALVDTNCDPSNIDYVIPSNDDAIRAIKLLVSKVADAVLEGKAMRKDIEEEPTPVEVSAPEGEEAELTDEELLGESTLAKLAYRPKVAVEGEEPPYGEEEKLDENLFPEEELEFNWDEEDEESISRQKFDDEEEELDEIEGGIEEGEE